MSGQSEIPLPEITREDFKHAWTRFELVAKAKEWDDNKQLAVIPTLLRGKLLDAFVELPAGTKDSLENLKKALSERAGVTKKLCLPPNCLPAEISLGMRKLLITLMN